MNTNTAPFAALVSKLGIHVDSIPAQTQRGAEMAARKAIREGRADQAAVYGADNNPLRYFGRGVR